MPSPNIDEFLAYLGPIQDAYRNTTFSYVAARRGETFVLLSGALFLRAWPTRVPSTHFESRNLRAGNYRLAEDLALDARGLLEQAMSGRIRTPGGELLFPPGKDTYGVSYEPFHSMGLRNQQRLCALTISGGNRPSLSQPSMDWELKASATPYYGVQEMLNVYDLGSLVDDQPATLAAYAFCVSAVDVGDSRVDDTKAMVTIRAAEGLDTAKIALRYRVLSQGQCVQRDSIAGGTLEWNGGNMARLARAEFAVPTAAVVDCIVTYEDVARHHWLIHDPSRAQNPRRAAYEALDPNLAVLSTYLSGNGRRPQDDFESGVAWLLWMLGFSPAHLGTSKPLGSADLVVTTPGGDFAVVECTTGLLKEESKMARLFERAEVIRKRIETAESGARVLPVMVTSKTRNEVRADLEAAEKLGVLVITREDLDEAVGLRTLTIPSADALYAEAQRVVRDAQARHEAQRELNLEK